ncbi:MAG: hypothetical protein ACT4PN_18145 [Nitrospiraceae bacterium]
MSKRPFARNARLSSAAIQPLMPVRGKPAMKQNNPYTNFSVPEPNSAAASTSG